MVGQEPAVGDQPALNPGPRSRPHQPDNIRVNERLASLEGHVTNPAAAQDRQSPRESLEIEVAAWTCEVLVAREATEIARGIAQVGHRNVADRGKQISLCSGCNRSRESFHWAPVPWRVRYAARSILTWTLRLDSASQGIMLSRRSGDQAAAGPGPVGVVQPR